MYRTDKTWQHTTDRKEQDKVTHLLPMTSPCSWINIPRSLNIWFTSIMSVYRHTYNNQHFTTAHSCVQNSWTLYGNRNTVKLHLKNYYRYFWLVFNWARFAFSAPTLLAGRQEENTAYKKLSMRCWHGYLSTVKCKWVLFNLPRFLGIWHDLQKANHWHSTEFLQSQMLFLSANQQCQCIERISL